MFLRITQCWIQSQGFFVLNDRLRDVALLKINVAENGPDIGPFRIQAQRLDVMALCFFGAAIGQREVPNCKMRLGVLRVQLQHLFELRASSIRPLHFQQERCPRVMIFR